MNDDSPPHAGYHVEAADLARDRAAVIAVWQANLPDPGGRARKYDWFYLGCPFGQPLLQVLCHDADVIGCCGATPRRMSWQGREIRAAVLGDIAVDEAHRTLGPALMLQQALLDAAAGRFDFLYGFPNPRSLPVVRRLGYRVLGERVRHARIVRYAPYLERHVPAWLARPLGALLDAIATLRFAMRAPGARHLVATWSDQPDPRMDALWQSSPRDRGLVGVHDSGMARWRFHTPHAQYASTRYLLLDDRRDGRLRAWFACQVKGSVLGIADYWCERGTDGIDAQTVLALAHAARRAGHASVSLPHAAGDTALTGWQRAGFVPRNRQPVVGRWLGDNPPTDDLARDWFLTEADEDE